MDFFSFLAQTAGQLMNYCLFVLVRRRTVRVLGDCRQTGDDTREDHKVGVCLNWWDISH